jgi:hypothetical protein
LEPGDTHGTQALVGHDCLCVFLDQGEPQRDRSDQTSLAADSPQPEGTPKSLEKT